MSLADASERFLPLIESDLQQALEVPHPDLAAYYGMMHYHQGWVDEMLQPAVAKGGPPRTGGTGKRLRPLLCLLACEAAGGDPRQAIPAGSAIELIHSFSLIHDDIEDSSPLRRGRRAVWNVWGVPHAINVGDGMFVLARLALHRLVDRGVPVQRCRAAGLAFDQACLALCEGQFFDMSFEGRPTVDLDQYLWMIRHKTATLLAASTQLGAMIATGDAGLIAHFFAFGLNLGIFFQIQDDVLGAWGDEQVTGKSIATDIRNRKKTLPIVYALNHPDDPDAARRLADLYARPGELDLPAIQTVLEILDRLDARQYADKMAGEYYRLALASLDETGIENAALSHLRELAASLLDRQA
ncbi:MAG: polyprenyl synthetase family protein [Anaerolineae bacterium]|nr:polyprenyl synthetase family protein [Anaerolineae bacterium]